MSESILQPQQVLTASCDVSAADLAAGEGAVALLAGATGLPRGRVKDAMSKGAVWRRAAGAERRGRARRLRRATASLSAGDRLEIYYNPAVLSEKPQPARLVDDRGSYSIWDKPPGLLCQGSRWGDHCTLLRFAERELAPRKGFVVHRLDRMASGLVVLAHSQSAARELSRQFAEREVTKVYHCRVYGVVEVQRPLLLDQPLDGKESRSWIERAEPLQVEGSESQCSELWLRIETGRKHQIRRHLAQRGTPIVGDGVYGFTERDRQNGQGPALQLRAVHLAFKSPESGELIEWKV